MAVVLTVSGPTHKLSNASLIELGVITLVVILTLTFFGVLGLAISTLTKSSTVALGASLAIWIVLVVVWPNIGSYIASSIEPVAPAQARRRLLLSKEAELDKAELDDHRKAAAELAALHTPVQVAWQRYLDIHRSWIEQRGQLVSILEDHKKQIHRQQAIERYLVAISPYGAYKEALGILSGTGVEEHEEFLTSSERYCREKFIDASLKYSAEHKPWTGSAKDEIFEVPSFEVSTNSLSQRLKSVAPLIAILALETVILIVFSLWKFEDYDCV
ncbi:MAG: hypothetical protein DMF60_17055 [Acidobacteria bacterium]|nr:MAG: hypothetical protein DMF60_17055 [Acidobacteriota bacterium]